MKKRITALVVVLAGTLIITSCEKPTVEGNYWHYVNNVQTIW